MAKSRSDFGVDRSSIEFRRTGAHESVSDGLSLDYHSFTTRQTRHGGDRHCETATATKEPCVRSPGISMLVGRGERVLYVPRGTDSFTFDSPHRPDPGLDTPQPHRPRIRTSEHISSHGSRSCTLFTLLQITAVFASVLGGSLTRSLTPRRSTHGIWPPVCVAARCGAPSLSTCRASRLCRPFFCASADPVWQKQLTPKLAQMKSYRRYASSPRRRSRRM